MKKRKLTGLVLATCMLGTTLSSGMAMATEAEAYDANNPPVATVEQGQLMGFMDDDTFTFLGVPYAQAERFEEPQEVEAWDGIRSAQAYGTVCPIPDQTSVGEDEMFWPHRYWIQNEDCQNLNIWTQSLDSEAKKPVLVFFHGGGYTNGSSIESAAYDGKNLSDYGDVVVVTVNHRLNVLGFLDLSEYGEGYANTANLGMEDCVAALQWVKDNIEAFGGDPDNVTIFGQSGGGGKVLSLMHMPSAEGLFQKVVVHSGSASYIDEEADKQIAAQTLENLGIDESNIDEIKTVDYHDLIQAGTDACTTVSEELGSSVKWTPQADGEVILKDYCDWSADIPVMVGSVFAEQNHTWTCEYGNKNEWTEEETMEYLTEKYGDSAETIAEEFQKVYPDRPLADVYFYDGARRIRVEQTLADRMETGSAPVYNFLFSYEAPVDGGILAFHCSDLIYTFHNVDIPVVTRATGGNEDAHRIQDQMASAWINFATTGDPSTDELSWAPYTAEEKNVMVFDVESGCGILGDETLNQLISDALS